MGTNERGEFEFKSPKVKRNIILAIIALAETEAALSWYSDTYRPLGVLTGLLGLVNLPLVRENHLLHKQEKQKNKPAPTPLLR